MQILFPHLITSHQIAAAILKWGKRVVGRYSSVRVLETLFETLEVVFIKSETFMSLNHVIYQTHDNLITLKMG